MIKGINVALTVLTQTGTDALNAPIYTESTETVSNVLVFPASDQEVIEALNLYGKKAVYTLCIPKGDTHQWMNTYVEFFGEKWRTIGHPTEYIEANIPLKWNKKVKVESIVGE